MKKVDYINEDFLMFKKELKIVENATAIINNDNISKDQLIAEFSELLKYYEKSIKSSIKLTKVSDANNKKLLMASEQIAKKKRSSGKS